MVKKIVTQRTKAKNKKVRKGARDKERTGKTTQKKTHQKAKKSTTKKGVAKKSASKKGAKKASTKETNKPSRKDDSPRLWLVDGSGYIFRAFYAIPTRLTRGKMPVNAVYGFTTMLLQLREQVGAEDCITVVFDAGSKSFRNDIYADYKANRSETPPELVPQFAPTHEAAAALGFPVVKQEGVEADDIIATYARLAEGVGMGVVIVSSDKDLMQLVRPGVEMWDPMKGRTLDESAVVEKFGVLPKRVADVQALAGDSSDNVPGVPGIGVKTAALLVNEYGDLESVLARAQEIGQPKRRQMLLDYAEQARLCLRLVRLVEDVEVPLSLAEMHARKREDAVLRAFLEKYEFRSILARLEREGALSAADGQTGGASEGAEGEKAEGKKTQSKEIGSEGSEKAGGVEKEGAGYQLLDSASQVRAWLETARADGILFVDTETTDLNPECAELVGISLSLLDGRAGYVPIGHKVAIDLKTSTEKPQKNSEKKLEKKKTDKKQAKGKPEAQVDLFAGTETGVNPQGQEPPQKLCAGQLSLEEVRALFAPVLADSAVLKVGHNIKYDMRVLALQGMEVAGVEDTMLLSHALEAGMGGQSMDALALRHLDRVAISYKEVTKAPSGRKALRFDEVALDKACEYAAEDAEITRALWQRLRPRLLAEGRTSIYEVMERPLIGILAEMESCGILIDGDKLRELSADFATRADALEAECHALAGREFTIGSPKQLGEVLFDELDLPHGGRKGKSGAKSTDHSVLEDLALQGFEIADKVLAWRSLTKLRSTYTEALLESMRPSGRVHTHFNQAGASTGRLSSSNPNLQNIPIRTADGRQIREAFCAADGHLLLSVDYSQIELRLAAEITDEPALKRAFAEGADIHTATAAEMFHLPADKVPDDKRREAKAINFGIIYGISPFGLARGLRIPQEEARKFMETYFARYPRIAEWMEATRKQVKTDGQVETLFGRVIHAPAIHSKNHQQRAFAERAAINAPIQGTAADIIKRAMIRLPAALESAGLKARLLLQVHDELILETPEDEVEKTSALVRAVMEEAPLPARPLSVPLVADAKAAPTWGQAH